MVVGDCGQVDRRATHMSTTVSATVSVTVSDTAFATAQYPQLLHPQLVYPHYSVSRCSSLQLTRQSVLVRLPQR